MRLHSLSAVTEQLTCRRGNSLVELFDFRCFDAEISLSRSTFEGKHEGGRETEWRERMSVQSPALSLILRFFFVVRVYCSAVAAVCTLLWLCLTCPVQFKWKYCHTVVKNTWFGWSFKNKKYVQSPKDKLQRKLQWKWSFMFPPTWKVKNTHRPPALLESSTQLTSNLTQENTFKHRTEIFAECIDPESTSPNC